VSRLVLLRHGESAWNRADRFAGWADVPLTGTGRREARRAARRVRERGIAVDVGFTSLLSRAIETAWIALGELGLAWIPLEKSWRLNERHYGALEGMTRSECARRFGRAQTERWRWSFEETPPPLEPADPRLPGRDLRYAGVPPALLPRSESLKDAFDRVLPLWEDSIAPRLREGRCVLVVAHGSSLRALVKHVEGVSDAGIVDVRIPTALPVVYELDGALRPTAREWLRDGSRPRAGRFLARQWARRVRRAAR
jgi:2,3-bisphosphoglycerate-dependent phosphoglycerate mutase